MNELLLDSVISFVPPSKDETMENVMKMLTDEGSLEGVAACDAGCGTGCLSFP